MPKKLGQGELAKVIARQLQGTFAADRVAPALHLPVVFRKGREAIDQLEDL